MTPGANVLDLGCGKGDNLAHLATLGTRPVGVDISAARTKPLRPAGPTTSWNSTRRTPHASSPRARNSSTRSSPYAAPPGSPTPPSSSPCTAACARWSIRALTASARQELLRMPGVIHHPLRGRGPLGREAVELRTQPVEGPSGDPRIHHRSRPSRPRPARPEKTGTLIVRAWVGASPPTRSTFAPEEALEGHAAAIPAHVGTVPCRRRSCRAATSVSVYSRRCSVAYR
ncbi:class I SAM-dependent methyltransferase [Streptomyces parvus]|uniref:class I SAM-dependent methyltransferase n=1 Tax=Streptomyces parvus TaxID=66428 RepID=UPI0033D84CF0